VQSEGFGGGEAIRTRWGAIQAFFEKVGDRLRPSGGVVTSRGSRDPQPRFLPGVGAEVIGKERIEAAGGEAELFGGFGDSHGAPPEGGQHMANEGRCMAIG
jgi:hypothetical protein